MAAGETVFIGMPGGDTEPIQSHTEDINPEIEVDNEVSPDAVDIVVYYGEKQGLQLKVDGGQNAQASELFHMVMDNLEFPCDANQLFSLWLVSDLLELQLKPTHVPFKLVCYWEELLEKYSSAPELDRQQDEPVIVFRRNVFCPHEIENKLLTSRSEDEKEQKMLELLYHEAKRNVLMGRYPLSQSACDHLAGIQSLIQQESAETLKNKVNQFLPAHFCKRNRIFGKESNPEKRISASRQSRESELRGYSMSRLYQEYVNFCRQKPYYGCAFFHAQVEHPGTRLLSSRVDDPVYVAINLYGVYVIDSDDFVLLIGLPYQYLSWQYAESTKSASNPDCLPCLFLQFPENALEGHEFSSDTKLFQVFSRETVLMDKLIEACIALRKSVHNDGSIYGKNLHEKIIKGQGEIADNFDRLALITYNKTENKVDRKSVRIPRSKSTRQ
jgi:hypothetical protein